VVTKPKKEGRKEGLLLLLHHNVTKFVSCCKRLGTVERRGEEVLYLLGKFGAIVVVVDGRKM
jgi:hypothetical protein